MAQFVLPVAFVLLVWWTSTGLVLWLVRRSRTALGWSIAAFTVAIGGAAWVLAVTANDKTVAAAYLAFTSAILFWGWAEITFLSGFATGPYPQDCPAECRGMRRFAYALGAILYHELVLIGFAVIIAAITWTASNQVGLDAFAILWTMRVSAKLNLFLGVPLLNDEFLSRRVAFLQSYFLQEPMNWLFPISITASSCAASWFAFRAIDPASSDFEACAYTFLAALVSLAVLEHWFMVLPLPVKALWHWCLSIPAPDVAGTAISRSPTLSRLAAPSSNPRSLQAADIAAPPGLPATRH